MEYGLVGNLTTCSVLAIAPASFLYLGLILKNLDGLEI